MNLKELVPKYQKVNLNNYKYRFTVFTPAYNAEKTIARTHESLLKQTFLDFEWLIINDGSTDSTNEVVQKIIKTSPLDINYVNNPKNQHKMACIMQAIDVAKGELLLTFDADDECLENALEVFDFEFSNIPEELKNDTIAVTGLCVDQHGNKIGTPFPENPHYSDSFSIRAIDKIEGEKWGFTKTDFLKGVKINENLFGKGYIPESLIWDLLSKEGFKTKFINSTLRIYYVGSENSISTSGNHRSDLGSIIMYISNFNWFFNSHGYRGPIFFLKNLYFLLRESKSSSFTLKTYIRSIDSLFIKFFFVMLWPFRKLFK